MVFSDHTMIVVERSADYRLVLAHGKFVVTWAKRRSPVGPPAGRVRRAGWRRYRERGDISWLLPSSA